MMAYATARNHSRGVALRLRMVTHLDPPRGCFIVKVMLAKLPAAVAKMFPAEIPGTRRLRRRL